MYDALHFSIFHVYWHNFSFSLCIKCLEWGIFFPSLVYNRVYIIFVFVGLEQGQFLDGQSAQLYQNNWQVAPSFWVHTTCLFLLLFFIVLM